MKVDVLKLQRLLKMTTHKQIVIDLAKAAGSNYLVYENKDFCIFVPMKMGKEDLIPCIVSHTDTVSSKKPKKFSYENGVLRNPDGVLGADDRAGVYCIYEMLKRNVNAIFILTDKEECGGIGATACAFDDYFQELAVSNISCLIELDRENKDHCATYGYDNGELIQIMNEKGGYNEDWGTYTDVATLAQNTELACVNLSVGYYRQHTKHEYLVVSELEGTLNFVIDLPKELYGQQFLSDETYFCKKPSYGRYSSYYYQETEVDSDIEEVLCEICGSHSSLYKYEMVMMCEECLDWYSFQFSATNNSWEA